jgi:AraC family transcriptional regulator
VKAIDTLLARSDDFAVSTTSRSPSLLDLVWIDVPPGRIEPAADSFHVLDFHASRSVHASIRLDSREMQGPQRHGDINIVPAGATGVWNFEADVSALLVRLAPALLEEAADAMSSRPSGLKLQPAMCVRDPHIEQIAWTLNEDRLGGNPRGTLWLESAAYAIAARLVRRSHNSLRLPRLHQRSLPKWRLRRVCDYIEVSLDQALSLRELAALAGFSVPHFKVLFSQSTGLPVHRYIVERRVERARQLILRGERMSSIALDVGFSHQSHMTRCLQRVLGMSPTQIVELYQLAPTSRLSLDSNLRRSSP